MVSIPDWARFSHLHDLNFSKSDSNGLLNRYHRNRELEAVKQAEINGYFFEPTHDYLINNCFHSFNGKSKKKDIKKLRVLKLPGLHIRKIGDISYCVNLKICLLNGNFLQKIDGLVSCRHLVKLDLHCNQLSSVPGITFWSGLRKLKFLYLHDNPIGKFETMHSLATCPQLITLTLYDTPLSLRKNYRHHVVNSVWSLKALDHYVISDEEIIEDAMFSGPFGTMQSVFRIDLSQPDYEFYELEDEMSLLRNLESYINRILKHWSPVHIIQRYVRGYLCRKRQPKKSRRTPGLPLAQILLPPPSTPITSSRQDVSHTDYDTYMQNRRASSDNTESSLIQQSLLGAQLSFVDEGASAQRLKKNIIINLSKLNSGGTFQNIQDDAAVMEKYFALESKEAVATGKPKEHRKKKKKSKKPKRIRSIRHFFGPMVPTSPDHHDLDDEIEDKDLITNYRLCGKKQKMFLVDQTTEMIIQKRDAGKTIRDAEFENEQRFIEQMSEFKIVAPKTIIRTHHKLFSKIHGTMGMSCLYAVQKAYKEREKAEKSAAKMEYILNLRDERNRAKERINFYHEERRNQIQKKRDEDRARMLDALEKHELQRLNYFDRRQEYKSKSGDIRKTFHADNTFVSEFSNQHTSVSNALLRHERQTLVEDQAQAKVQFVKIRKQEEVEQLDTVKKYLEHRKLIRQNEGAAMRSDFGTKLLQEANDHIMEAKTRVEQQKARRATVQAFYPLPPRTLQPSGSVNGDTFLTEAGFEDRRHTTMI